MDQVTSSMGWLIPTWILGAPLLAGLIMMMRGPRHHITHRTTQPTATAAPMR
jgi:hypothetical protein